MSRKIIVHDGGDPLVWELDSDPCVLGRDGDCDVVLDCDRASRRHLRITALGDDVLAEDLGSSNGTLLNGEPLVGKALVSRGDVLAVGSATIHIDAEPVAVARGFGGQAPPATRRAASDRRSTNNTPLVLGVAIAVIAAMAWVMWPDTEAPEETPSEVGTAADGDAGNESVPSTDTPEKILPPTSTIDAEEVRQRKERSRAIANLGIEVEELLVQDAFADALDAIDAHEKRWGGRRRTQRRLVEAAMEKASIRIRTEYHRLAGAGRQEVARAKIREALTIFPESTHRTALEALAAAPLTTETRPEVARDSTPSTSAEGAEPVTTTSVAAPPMPKSVAGLSSADAERKFFAKNEDAEQLFVARDYTGAARAYEELVHLGRRGQVDFEYIEIARSRARVAANLAEFRTALEAVLTAQSDRLTKIPVLPGRSGNVKSGGAEGIVFDMDGVDLEVSWRVLREEALVAIVQKAELGGRDGILAAAFLYSVDKERDADRLLARGFRQAPEAKDVLDRVLAGARGIDVPEGGFIEYDKAWVTPGELARIRVREAVAASTKDLQSTDAEVRATTYAKLRALGPRAHSAFHRALVESKEQLLTRLDGMAAFEKLMAISASHAKLEEARHHALDLIFDTEKYPYPYRGRGQEVMSLYQETQKEVDARVAVVREIWKANPTGRLTPEIRDAVTVLLEYDRELFDIDLGMGPETPSFMRHLQEGAKDLSLQSFAATPEDRTRIDTSREWMAANAEMKSSASREERKQIRVTNDYRLMMGRHAVKLHEKLLLAARGHSQDMATLGFFSHTNDINPEKRTPRDRVLLAGFAGVGVSENIALNGGGAIGAHNAWIHSSGHHRNILGKSWRLLGSGNSGTRWTQNFSIREYTDAEKSARGLGVEGGDGTPEDTNPDQ